MLDVKATNNAAFPTHHSSVLLFLLLVSQTFIPVLSSNKFAGSMFYMETAALKWSHFCSFATL